MNEHSRMTRDTVAVHDEQLPGQRLLWPVMSQGRRVSAPQTLIQLQEQTLAQLSQLPQTLRSLEKANQYPVVIAESLHRLARTIDEASAG